MLKLTVFRQGDDKSVVQFSSCFVHMWTQSHPQGATFVCGSRFQDQAKLISLSPLLSLSLSLYAFLCRYPIQSPRPGCYGDREDSPGVRNYGNRSPDELFDVYCFTKQLEGKSQELQAIILGLVMHRVTNLWVCSTVMWPVLNTLLSTERERAVGGDGSNIESSCHLTASCRPKLCGSVGLSQNFTFQFAMPQAEVAETKSRWTKCLWHWFYVYNSYLTDHSKELCL